MSNLDLRGGIIPTRLKNCDPYGVVKNKYDTVDLIYIDSYSDWFENEKITDKDRRASATDSALVHNTWVSDCFETNAGKFACAWQLRSACSENRICFVLGHGDDAISFANERFIGLRPAMHYNLSLKNSKFSILNIFMKGKSRNTNNEFKPNIIQRKNKRGKTLYHCLLLGKTIGDKVDEKLNETLESLYNNGNLNENLIATGRWYTYNGQKEDEKNFAGAHSPIFEYKGNRYVREISCPETDSIYSVFSDGTEIGRAGRAIWKKEEDYSWIIRNWDDLPKSINPKGNESAKDFDLLSEEVTIGNMPFYPMRTDENSTMWQNSMPRGFLNGIDVRNITQNGNPEHGAARGGDFSGECNFLNETFNLGREPILEFKIPESETEIPDDAFNRVCILKKNIYT